MTPPKERAVTVEDPEIIDVDGGNDRAAALIALMANAAAPVPAGAAAVAVPVVYVDYTPTGVVHDWPVPDGTESGRFLVRAKFYARNFAVENWEGKRVKQRFQANRGDVVVLPTQSPDTVEHMSVGYIASVSE